MELEKLQSFLDESINYCKSLNKCIHINDICEHILEEDIICIQSNILICSISNGNSKCDRQATHIAICKDDITNTIHLCWYHCLELFNRINE